MGSVLVAQDGVILLSEGYGMADIEAGYSQYNSKPISNWLTNQAVHSRRYSKAARRWTA